MTHRSIGVFSDTTPTVAWITRLCAKNSIIVGHLLRAIALRTYVSKSSPTVTAYKKGSLNTRADNASRWFISSHNTHDLQINNANFLKIFTRTYPQTIPWHEFRPSTGLSLKLINVLRGKVSTLASRLRLPKYGGSIGTLGSNTHTTWTKARIRTNDDIIVALTGFAARVRSEAYGRRRQVGVQTVTDALGVIATTFKLAGKAPPTHIEAGRYILPLQRQLEAYRREDPPPTPQLVLPVKVAEEIMSSGCLTKATPIEAATGELGLTDFYYLLRVGEYTNQPPIFTGIEKIPTKLEPR